MAVFSKVFSALAAMFPLLAAPALAGSIADIEHVVLFMQG
jgi:phospholipase C